MKTNILLLLHFTCSNTKPSAPLCLPFPPFFTLFLKTKPQVSGENFISDTNCVMNKSYHAIWYGIHLMNGWLTTFLSSLEFSMLCSCESREKFICAINISRRFQHKHGPVNKLVYWMTSLLTFCATKLRNNRKKTCFSKLFCFLFVKKREIYVVRHLRVSSVFDLSDCDTKRRHFLMIGNWL